MNTVLIKKKLDIIIRKYNFAEAEMSVDSMLGFAMAAEQTCQDIGAFDPAYQHFKQQQLDFENAASYLEQLQSAVCAEGA